MKELDRETVRQILCNYLHNSEEVLDEDRTVQVLSQILSDPVDMALGKIQHLIKSMLDEEIDQIQVNSVDEDGCLDRERALEECFDPVRGIDDFVGKVMDALEKEGKLAFRDTDPKTFLTNPEKPLSTYKRIKEAFGTFSEFVWWLDKQFGPDGFMYLLDLDPHKVHEIRLLSGPANVNDKFKKSYLRAKREFEGQGLHLQARVILDKGQLQEIHDRFLVDEKAAYALPPVNILADKWATVTDLPQEEAKHIQSVFKRYWQNAVDPLSGDQWMAIQEVRDKLKEEPSGGL